MSSGAVFLGVALLIFWRRAKAIVRKSPKSFLAEPEVHGDEHVSLLEVPLNGQPKYGKFVDETYVFTRSSGFFSEMSTALLDLALLGAKVKKLDTTRALLWFKDTPEEDLFAHIFRRSKGRGKTSSWLASNLPHHSIYAKLPFHEIAPIRKRWFSPTRDICSRARGITQASGVQPSKMIAVNLRGSHKYKEVDPTPVEHWVTVVGRLRALHPGLTVCVFSDDQDLVDQFSAQAPFPTVDFGQEVRTRGGSSIVNAFRSEPLRSEATKNFVARTLVVSKARFVVTHTGNTAYWTALFRGCACGLFQFTTKPGELVYSAQPCDSHFRHRKHRIALL